ncbi:MAG: tRNA (adenosine(37)-N6)-threonylcarbamoyltransferase complex dimerization subunit type 1 TsaB [Acidobacteriota bacterium]
MYILAIDTATNSGGAALSQDSEVIGLVVIKTPLRYSEKILYIIDFLLHQHDLDLAEMDCFAVATGPGSFTGLRIGLATVKAFCQGLNKPVIPLSTRESLAYRFRSLSPRVAPMIDARRGQIFGAVYQIENSHIEIEGKEQVMSPTQWLKGVPADDCIFVGDGARLYKKTIVAAHPEARVLETDNRLLEELCQLAYVRFTQGKMLSAKQLAANYVRPSDAELKRRSRFQVPGSRFTNVE